MALGLEARRKAREAEDWLRQTLSIREKLAPEDAKRSSYKLGLARARFQFGKLQRSWRRIDYGSHKACRLS